jgi:hypothetical protein
VHSCSLELRLDPCDTYSQGCIEKMHILVKIHRMLLASDRAPKNNYIPTLSTSVF